jgi:small ligand-binding sensory domain FIST
MLLSGDFEINSAAASACAPLGTTHEVTSARDNIILELDGRKAFEVFSEAAGPLAAELRRALMFVFLGVPLEEGSERLQRASFYVRNIIGASEEHGAIAVAHRPNVGDRVGFVLRDAERSRNELKATLEALQMRSQSPPAVLRLYLARFGLVPDSGSRLRLHRAILRPASGGGIFHRV